jgi:N-acetylmuramoyl-L-alanine amidase
VRSTPIRTIATLVSAALVLAACGGTTASQPPPTPPPASTDGTPTDQPTTVATPEPPPSQSSSASRPSSSTSKPPTTVAAGKVVVIDPGHNGGNASNPAEINRQVPAGRGRTKPCNTTGTATNAGFTEHAFTWDVAARLRERLAEQGIKVVMTRPDDSGVGPCVDRRAAIGNQAGAAAVVSIHADGSTSPGAHGFHVAYSAPPLNAAQGEPSLRLARVMRDQLRSAGFATSTYIGKDGLSPRDDLGGLNLSERPTVLVECGNMRNADEAAVLSSPGGRQKYADAIMKAVVAYLS